MPAAVPVVAGIAASFGLISVGTAIFLTGATLYGEYNRRRMERKARRAARLSEQARATSFRQAITTRRYVYGEQLVGGPITFLHSTDNNQYLNLLITLSAHELAEIGDVYFNDELIPIVDGQVTGKYAGHAEIWKGLGSTAGDSALLTALQTNASGKWTANHKQADCGKLYVRLKWDQDLYAGGIPNIRAMVKGKKLYDPRTATTGWSNNAALVIRDYVTGAHGLGASGFLNGWQFIGTTDGWSASNATLTAGANLATLTALTSDPQITRGGLSIDGSVNRYVLTRIRQTVVGVWSGQCFYGNGAHGDSELYTKVIPAPAGLTVGGDWVIAVWDMHDLTFGGDDWKTSTITSIRLDFAAEAGAEFEIDWIAYATHPFFELNDDSIVTAANVCDEAVTLADKVSAFTAQGGLPTPPPTFGASWSGSPINEDLWVEVFYSVTFYDASGETLGSHTLGPVLGGYWAIAGDDVTVNSIPLGPSGTVGRKLYRSLSATSGYGLVTTIADNVTTSYLDDASTSPGAAIPTTNTTAPGHMLLSTSGMAFRAGDGVQLSTTGTLPGGLAAATTYYVIDLGEGRFRLATSLANARAGTAISITSYGTGTHTVTRQNEPRYTADGVIDTEDKPRENLQDLLTAMAGALLYVNGKWVLYAGAYRAPTVTLDEDDLDGPIQVTTRLGRRNLFNAVKGVYLSPQDLYQPTDFPPVTNATYLSEDNDERIWRDMELPWTSSPSAAQRIAKIELERIRQQITAKLPCKLTALRAQAGDVIGLTNSRFGWGAKPFEVVDFEFVVRADGDVPRLGIDLFLRETASTVYDWSSGEETTIDPAPDTDLPNPFEVDAPTGLALASGTEHLDLRRDGTVFSRLYVSWTQHPDLFVQQGGRIEIEYRKASVATWTSASSVPGDQTYTYLLDVEDTVAYYVSLRAVNALGVKSAWTLSDPHTVVGKTAPPSDVTGLAFDGVFLSWLPITDLDRAGYVVRYGTDWDTATPAHEQGWVTDTRLDLRAIAGGSITLLVRAVDTSGNLSASAASLAVDLRPATPTSFLVTRQPDGTREFTWALDEPDDLAGYRIRYYLGTTSDWSAMSDLHQGLLNASPYESNQLAAGTYTFAIKAVDQAGNESASAKFITTTIGDPRIAGSIEDVNEAPTWTGTKTNCSVDATTGGLIADNTETWADIPTTWDAWISWHDAPASPITYVRQIDVGVITSFAPLVSVTVDGTPTIEEQHSDDDITYTSYAAIGPQVTARYIRIRVSVSGSFPKIKTMRTILSADPVTEVIEDLDTSTLAACNPSPSCSTSGHRIAPGDIRLPTAKSYAVIKKVGVTLQNVGPGWDWELIDKDTAVGPRIKIYNGAGTLADATIDAEIKGI